VRDRLRETMPGAEIVKVERIQNVLLWDYYSMRKQRMRKVNGGREPKEVSVWHGTSGTDPQKIYEDRQDGFMMQYCTGGMWGRGLYFAEKARYSNSYAHKISGTSNRCFFLAKLLVGDEVRVMPANGSLKMCPDREDGKGRYDTVTGETAGSKVYIVYENGRALPEYLITYRTT
jgi:hypothetical protein